MVFIRSYSSINLLSAISFYPVINWVCLNYDCRVLMHLIVTEDRNERIAKAIKSRFTSDPVEK